MRELWINIAQTSGAKIYSMLVGLFVLFLTARLLGPEGRGQIAAISTWVNLFCTFSFLSLGQVALHQMANDPRHHRFGTLLGSLLLFAFVLTLLGWLVAFVWQQWQPEQAFKNLPTLPLLIGFLALPFLIWEQYGSSLLMGIEQLKLYNRWQVVGRTLSVLLVFLFVGALEMGVEGVLSANLLGQIVVAMGGITFLTRFACSRNLSCWPEKIQLFALLSGGIKLHLNAIGSFLFASANILILNHYHGDEPTGYFQLATQLIAVLMIVPQAATMAIYGKVTQLGPNGAWPENKRLLMQITFFMIVLGGIGYILAPFIIPILAGDSFQPAIAIFQWLLLGLIGMTFSTLMAPQWIGRGYFWQAAGVTLLVGIISLTANFLFIPKLGIQGVIYAYLCTYGLSLMSNGLMALYCDVTSKVSNDCVKQN